MGSTGGFYSLRRRRWRMLCAMAAVGGLGSRSHGQALNGTVSIIPVSANSTASPYYATDLNSCAVDLNNLVTATVGGVTYQFVAYYDVSGNIWLGRRTPGAAGATAWTSFNTGITLSSSLLSDDHNTAAIAVDSTGHLNIAWGMHNVSLNYAISSASVMGATFTAPSFNVQTASNAPTLFPSAGSTTNEATYPDFYNIPGSSDLLFAYRNGGAGGGSGNGNEYFNVYDPASNTWTNSFVINGEQTSVNAYLNNLVYSSTGNLLMSWTWRASPAWQSNSNIMFAQSPDNGATWTKQGGTTSYTLPIIQTGTPSASVGQVIKALPQNTSFINQTSMAVDVSNNPIIATYWAPGTTGTTDATKNPNKTTNNPNLQYMLEYYDGSAWRTSQISNRTSDTAFDTSAADVRDLGRPIVVVDKNNRVLVLTRSEDTGQGKFSNPATVNNGFVVYWNTVASLDSASPQAWQQLTLDTATQGQSEPTIDANLWSASNVLDVMYEPTGLTGQTSSALSVLEWNEQTYFASITPNSLSWDSNIGTSGVQDGSGTWDLTNLNFSGGGQNYAWNNSLGLSVTFGAANASAGIVTLGQNISVKNLTFNAASSGNYTIAGGGSNLVLLSGSTITTNVNATIAAPLTGGGFTKSGSATLTLSGNNTYSGATLVSAGTLAITGSIQSPSVTVSTSATLNASGTINDGLATNTAMNVSGQVNLAAGILNGGIAPRTLSSLTLNSGGIVQLAAPVSHADRQVLVVDSLTLGNASNTWQGKLDLTGNDMIVHNGVVANIFSQLQAGFNAHAGVWQGLNGIVSSAASSDTRNLTTLGYRTSDGTPFDGVSTTTTDVLVKYTYYGDADLSGIVDGADYQQIDAGFGSHLTGWSNGDFNYDGVVNGSDFALIDNTFNQLSATNTGPLMLAAQSADLIASISQTAMPEPCAGLLFGGALTLFRRRRRPICIASSGQELPG